MSMPNLIFVKFLSIMKQWWQKQVDHRKREQAWKKIPEVKPPAMVRDIVDNMRREVARPKPPYNRNIHSQPMKEDNEKRNTDN